MYYTLNNGANAFKVVIKKHKIEVFRSKHVKSFEVLEPKKVLIGKSPKNPMTLFSGAYGPKFDGNSILINTKNDEYMYIGSSVYTFTSLAKITHFSSPVGNNGVPYPFAIDEMGNYYLLIENVVILYHKSLENKIKKAGDPYDYFYNYVTNNSIPFYVHGHQKYLPYAPEPIEKYKWYFRKRNSKITRFKAHPETHITRFKAHPETEITRFKAHPETEITRFKAHPDTTLEEYIAANKAFGKKHNFQSLKAKIIIKRE